MFLIDELLKKNKISYGEARGIFKALRKNEPDKQLIEDEFRRAFKVLNEYIKEINVD